MFNLVKLHWFCKVKVKAGLLYPHPVFSRTPAGQGNNIGLLQFFGLTHYFYRLVAIQAWHNNVETYDLRSELFHLLQRIDTIVRHSHLVAKHLKQHR